MKKLLLLLLLCSIAYGQGWNNPQQKPWLGLQVDWSHPQSEGLVGFWPGNEGSGNTVQDLSGNNNTGVLTGTAPSWTAGKFGSCINLPGTNEYVLANPSTSIHNACLGGNVTISILWRTDNLTKGNQSLFTLYVNGDNRLYAEWEVTPAIQVYAEMNNVVTLTQSTGAPNDILWHHFIFVFDTTTTLMFVDGVHTTTFGSSVSLQNIQGSPRLEFGSNVALNHYSEGQIDNVSLYNRALSASEIAKLYAKLFCMMQGDLPVSMMYAEAPAPAGGQVIIIASMFLPVCVILSISLALVFSRKWNSQT